CRVEEHSTHVTRKHHRWIQVDTAERMASVLGMSGQAGWELVTIFDKSSNWFVGMEKGFMLLRRRVPAGVEPDEWAIQYRA
ncbi:hypothetical protein, partial [Candidatus Microthrix parvicella]|uniref:hypothetical protein n=1 Tax=Candidatus Neomicrothrix parvicella TaxID=41950 RepID=UPI001F4764D5